MGIFDRFKRAEEKRSSGSFSDSVQSYLLQAATGKVADAGALAAVEAVAGLLSRAFMGASIEGEHGGAISRPWLAQVGRDLIRSGESLSAVVMDSATGNMRLETCAYFTWESDAGPDERSWRVRATSYGPSSDHTRLLPRDAVVFVRWGSAPGTLYLGQSARGFANLSARLASETERSLADESGGPLAQMIPLPSDPSDPDSEGGNAYLAGLTQALTKARGSAVLLETTAAGFGEGMSAAPRRDWKAERLGANPPAALVDLHRESYMQTLAMHGCPPALMLGGGTAQGAREALRQWHLDTVRPLGSLLSDELSERLGEPIRLVFDNYPMDMAGRAVAFGKLVQGGMPVDRAAAVSGVLTGDDA